MLGLLITASVAADPPHKKDIDEVFCETLVLNMNKLINDIEYLKGDQIYMNIRKGVDRWVNLFPIPESRSQCVKSDNWMIVHNWEQTDKTKREAKYVEVKEKFLACMADYKIIDEKEIVAKDSNTRYKIKTKKQEYVMHVKIEWSRIMLTIEAAPEKK